MPRRISTLLKVTSKSLEDKGVFDGFIDIDSNLHFDPALIKGLKIPEFRSAHSDFEKYYKEILALIVGSTKVNDRLWKEAHNRLQCKEIANTGLGYSLKSTSGSAIGPVLALNILNTVSEIVAAGINDPIIFELVGVFEEKIGADRISDMTIFVLLPHLASFTQRVSKELGITTKKILVKDSFYSLPFDVKTGKPIFLTPKKILNNLPVASSWEDIDSVIQYNTDLRSRVNNIIGKSWKSAMKAPKRELKKYILENPELLKDLIKQYKVKPRTPYDFSNDPIGEIIWAELSEKAPLNHPLNLSSYKPVTSKNILLIVREICLQFASLIQNNGWFEYLYVNGHKLKPERAPQLLFYGIADTYCKANDLDLSREPNAGVGALDFKISKGYKEKVTVEIKYSTNTNLIKGYLHQLPTYNKAEKVDTSIYLVIQTKRNKANINRLLKLEAEAKLYKKRAPEIILIDGQRQLSASLRRG